MLIAFIPVLHTGYLELFKQHPEELGILGLDVIADYTALTRDLRVIDPQVLKQAIEGLRIFPRIRVLSKADLATLGTNSTNIIMPDDDVSRELSKRYFGDKATFTQAAIRYRWDKTAVTKENTVTPDRTVSGSAVDRELMQLARAEGEKSQDWWRQVGAAILKDGQVLAQGHNHHLPSDFHLGVNGDPRSNFNAGERIDLSTAIHAEASLIANAAKLGTPLNGATIYVSTFPCPNCARLIAEAGISKVYYQKGYSLLDAEEIFKSYQIEIILVQD
ncbi:MAG: deaminase [Patescibacteria group bacterium]